MDDARNEILAVDWDWLADFTAEEPMTWARLEERFQVDDPYDINIELTDPEEALLCRPVLRLDR